MHILMTIKQGTRVDVRELSDVHQLDVFLQHNYGVAMEAARLGCSTTPTFITMGAGPVDHTTIEWCLVENTRVQEVDLSVNLWCDKYCVTTHPVRRAHALECEMCHRYGHERLTGTEIEHLGLDF